MDAYSVQMNLGSSLDTRGTYQQSAPKSSIPRATIKKFSRQWKRLGIARRGYIDWRRGNRGQNTT